MLFFFLLFSWFEIKFVKYNKYELTGTLYQMRTPTPMTDAGGGGGMELTLTFITRAKYKMLDSNIVQLKHIANVIQKR